MTSAKLPPPFPLAWPDEWPRTPSHHRGFTKHLLGAGGFKVTAPRAYDLLKYELENWREVAFRTGSRGSERLFVVTSNVVSRQAGKPVNDRGRIDDPGVAVWWVRARGGLRVVACDTWPTVAENLRACGVVVESLRAMERAGASQVLDRAQAAMTARGLPGEREWWRALLDLPHGEFSAAEVERAYKRAAVTAHPDQGGSHEAFVELTRARDEALFHATAECAQ